MGMSVKGMTGCERIVLGCIYYFRSSYKAHLQGYGGFHGQMTFLFVVSHAGMAPRGLLDGALRLGPKIFYDSPLFFIHISPFFIRSRHFAFINDSILSNI